MFDAHSDQADERGFAERCGSDRHHFRFIVSPEDAQDMADLQAFRYVELATSHDAMVTAPDELAKLLVGLVN
jgi:hypothetical protein